MPIFVETRIKCRKVQDSRPSSTINAQVDLSKYSSFYVLSIVQQPHQPIVWGSMTYRYTSAYPSGMLYNKGLSALSIGYNVF